MAETDSAACRRRAVSAYRYPPDLQEFTRPIRTLHPRPVLRLHQHGHHAFGTALYVTPE